MKQNIFETRQRAEELMKQAVEMWNQSDQSEQLDGLEEDPVFRMLINAVAYQSNEFDSQIEQLKEDILDEFSKIVIDGEGGKAQPATAVLTMKPADGVDEVDVDDNCGFVMRGSMRTYNFIPLIKTRLYNITSHSIERLDSRRWLVGLDFMNPVTSLQGLAFLVNNQYFHDVKIMIADNAMELPLIAPWDNSSLPMTDSFSMDTMLYNRKQAVSTGRNHESLTPYHRNCAMDIFARQNARFYVVDMMNEIEPHLHLDLLFEFDGTMDSFEFSDNTFFLNTVLVTNASINTVTVTTKKPIARIAGMANDGTQDQQFMHLVQSDTDNIFNSFPIEVRRVYADRFNRGRLQKLMHNLIAKYSSDYYAFQNFGSFETDALIQRIRRDMASLDEKANSQQSVYEGVYVILANGTVSKMHRLTGLDEALMDVKYLTTDGASLNSELTQQTHFDGPSVVMSDSIRQVTIPVPGMDEVYGERNESAMSRYFVATEDRLVTPADIKLFCMTELMTRYGISRSLITSIRISHQQVSEGSYTTYQTLVNITLQNIVSVQRALADKLNGVEIYLQKMIEVRTNGMYPVKVKMEIK